MEKPKQAPEGRRAVVALAGLIVLLLLTGAYLLTDQRFASRDFPPPRLLRVGDDYVAVTQAFRDPRMLSIVIGLAMRDLQRDEGASGFVMPRESADLTTIDAPLIRGQRRSVVRTNIIELLSGGEVRYEDYAAQVPSSSVEAVLGQGPELREYPRGVSALPDGSGTYYVVGTPEGRILIIPSHRAAGLIR